jgi:LCP family protein required for cell wall assembly
VLSPEEITRKQQELSQKRAWKRMRRRRRLISGVFLCLFGLLLLTASAYVSYQIGLAKRGVPPAPGTFSQEPLELQCTHILFLGTDSTEGAPSRTDTILLAVLDPDTGHGGIISIPRDTRVYVPERDRWDRINAVHVYGGPELTVKTVSEFLGVRIDYYIETDFAGFSKIIDTLGGVEINVEKDMQYTDVAGGLYIDIKAGPQVLDGKTALEYVRYRDYLGDVALVDPNYEIYGGRVERQRKFILAVIKEVLQPKTLLKLPRLLRQIWDAVDTNAPWTTALKLAFAADRFTLDRIETAIVPGTSEQINGAWYWIADSERTKQVVDWIIHGVPLPLTAEVLNGTGVQGIAAAAAEIVREHNLDVKRVGNANHFNYPVSQIIVGSQAAADRVEELADYLQAEVMIDPSREQIVDVTIIVGKNFSK